MLNVLLILGAALLGQSTDAVFGMNGSAGVPTFKMSINGTELPAPVLLSVNRDWWREGPESLPAGFVGVWYTPDTPWAAVAMERVPRGAILTPETPALRKERLKAGWKTNGYEFMKLPSGEEAPVRTVDKALAAQAATDAAAVAKVSAPDSLKIGGAAAHAPQQHGGEAPPVWRGFIGHALLIVLALIAGAVILKFLVLGEDEGWERIG